MTALLSLKTVAASKGCSRKTVQRACESGKLTSEFDPATGEYQVVDDDRLAQWQPGGSGKPPA